MAVKAVPMVMSDESVNCYGFRILTAGIDTSDFERNPIGYWNHRDEDTYKETALLPLFKWQNLKREGTRLLGDLIPDEDDTEAMKVYGKLDRGFVNACSVVIDIIATSEDPTLMLPGQTSFTVTKCKLINCDPCGVPGNSNALKLRNSTGQIIKLSADNAQEVLKQFSQNKNKSEMETPNAPHSSTLLIALSAVFGLSNATEQQILTAASQLKSDKEKADNDLQTLHNDLSKSMLDEAETSELITADERPGYEAVGKASLNALRMTLAKLSKAKTPAGNGTAAGAATVKTIGQELRELNKNSGGAGNAANASTECEYDQLRKNNVQELSRIQTEEPERYAALKQEKLSRVTPAARKGAQL